MVQSSDRKKRMSCGGSKGWQIKVKRKRNAYVRAYSVCICVRICARAAYKNNEYEASRQEMRVRRARGWLSVFRAACGIYNACVRIESATEEGVTRVSVLAVWWLEGL